MGAWEVTDDSSICYSGRCMVQVATQYPICWDNDCTLRILKHIPAMALHVAS